MERYEEAWADIEESAKLLVNADVPKLAGIIAYRRKQLEVSRAKFEESLERNADDCETGFYLGVVLGDLRTWPRVTDVMGHTAACLQGAEFRLNIEIERIRSGIDSAERKNRQIARRERQIVANRRMLVTSWFNTAVAHYNLSHAAEARQFAERVAEDQEFGERAKEILSRLK